MLASYYKTATVLEGDKHGMDKFFSEKSPHSMLS